MKIAVIGAGPAGLTAAYRLQQRGADVTVFEASDAVGGLARTIDLWGHRVDLGPHRFFSKDKRVNGLWNEILGQDYRLVERQTRIYYDGRFFQYPLEIANVLRNLGAGEIARSIASFARQKFAPEFSPQRRDSFESWVVSQFGRRLYEMFFKSYSEKLWGIPCAELDADFAAQRIKRFNLAEAMLAATGFARRQHATIVEQFAYPKGGSGELYVRLANRFAAAGGRLRLSQRVGRVLADGERVNGLLLEQGTMIPFDHIVSTMPLTLLLEGLQGVPAEILETSRALRFRSTILVYLKVESPNLFSDQWLYIHEPEVAIGRVTNFRNWVPELYGSLDSTVLALEYWAYPNDELWLTSDAELIQRAMTESRKLSLIPETVEISAGHVVRLPRCYPVYARGYKATLSPIIRYLDTIDNLWPIGRYGSFKYNNQDHSILMGLLAAENILQGGRHDLWSINTDYEDYQEDGELDVEPAAAS